MNSLQIELNNINQQLEHLNAKKAQLEPIISEYTDVINRVKNLTENMIALNIEPTNLRFDLEDILEGNAPGWGKWCSEPDTTPEPTPEPQPGQDFPTDWIDATTEAHSEQPEDYDTFYPELTPEPTPQPVKMFAFIPVPTLTPEPTPAPSYCPRCLGTGIINKLIPEPATPDPDYDQWDVIAVPCPECTPKPEPEPLTQINMQAYRRQNNTLLIGFTSKRLLNTWEKWFIKSTPHVKTSNSSDRLQGFNYCLTLTWDTDRSTQNWEYLAKLNYSLKPTEQKYQSSVTVTNSEEE